MESVLADDFFVIGMEGRITDASLIPSLWGRFMREAPIIPNRTDPNTVAVYCDYESDEHGAYSLCLGAKVSAVDDIPQGLTVRKVAAGRYEVFTSEQGPLSEVVPKAWQRVWAAPITRRFETDFELYDTRAMNPQDARIDLYIGLK